LGGGGGRGGGRPPTECRAGDDSDGHDPPRNMDEQLTSIYESYVLPFIYGCFVVHPYFGGGGSVRRRNALHEVGGRP
jgi:hypothetical protein